MKIILLLLFCCLLFVGCADTQPEIQSCLTGHEYGFWGGLWHGIIAPFAFIGSLFENDIAVYAINNNGAWYNLGFVLGASVTIGGSTKVKKKRK